MKWNMYTCTFTSYTKQVQVKKIGKKSCTYKREVDSQCTSTCKSVNQSNLQPWTQFTCII